MLKKNHDEYTTRTQEETTYYLGQVKILREKSKLNNISFFEKDKLKVFKRDYNKIREYMYKEYISSSATFLFGSQMQYATMSQYHRHVVYFYMTNENINLSQDTVIIRKHWKGFLSNHDTNQHNTKCDFVLIDVSI